MEENIRIRIKRQLQEHNRRLGSPLGEGELIEAVRELYQRMGEHGFLHRYGENIPLLMEEAKASLRAMGRLRPVLVGERVKLIPASIRLGAGMRAQKGLIKRKPVLKRI